MALCQWKGCDVDVPLTEPKRSRNGYLAPGYQRKYCDEHRSAANRRNGGRNASSARDGTRKVDATGYVRIRVAGLWLPEHRVVMEGKLGRELRRGESVHHKNGKRADNRPENLELWVGPIRWGQRASEIVCPHCGEAYL